jgi:tRNA(fMet)-specific endonuclease VapC
MTGNNFLVDTSIIIDFFKGEQKATTFLKETSESVFIPATVTGELYFGVFRSSNINKHLLQVEDFISQFTILPSDIFISKHYGILKSALYKKGKPIPDNDIWIAACAIHYNFVLVARDNHFKEIDGLNLISL